MVLRPIGRRKLFCSLDVRATLPHMAVDKAVTHDLLNRRPLWIVGPGAVGMTLATLLSPERRVTLIARKDRCDALRMNPLRITGSRTVEASPHSIVIQSADELRSPDHPIDVWLAVKANDLSSALKGIADVTPPGSVVSVLSNGLGIFDDARRTIPSTISLLRILPSFGAYQTTPTETRLAGDLIFTVAGEPADSVAIERTTILLSRIGAQVRAETDIRLAEWRKAVINLMINPLCALADRENGTMITEPSLRTMLPLLLREIEGVARAEGVPLGILTADDIIVRLAPHASNLNSMLIDMRSGRRTEIDYITGRFLAAAQRRAISTPLLRAIYDTIKAAEVRTFRPSDT